MKRGLDVPVAVIVLCFIFGAWPVGVVLAVLKAINSDYKKQQKQWQSGMNYNANQSQQQAGNAWWTNASGTQGTTGANSGYTPGSATSYGSQTNTGYTSGTSSYSGQTNSGYSTGTTASYSGQTNPAQSAAPTGPNGTTYHYSYVKKDTATSSPSSGTTTQYTSAPQSSVGTQGTVPQMPQTRRHKHSVATVLSTVFMGISLAVSVILFLVAVGNVAAFDFSTAFGSIVATMISSSISAALYLFRQFYKSRDYRIISYMSALHGERYYSIEKLAAMVDVSTKRVIKDLHYMQAKGILPNEAVIDRGLGYLILFKSARAEAEADSRAGAPVKAEPEAPAQTKTPEEIAADMSEHEKILHRIRELNDDIDDETVSEKIDKIEALTRKIFKLVEEKPEMEGQLGMFLSYYLPTTLKLLNSYAYFEEQGVRGENIDAGMRNIEETLDMLIDGYKTQLDKLFEADTLDVTTDINVLEQMMKADGFARTEDFTSGTATATIPENETEAK